MSCHPGSHRRNAVGRRDGAGGPQTPDDEATLYSRPAMTMWAASRVGRVASGHTFVPSLRWLARPGVGFRHAPLRGLAHARRRRVGVLRNARTRRADVFLQRVGRLYDRLRLATRRIGCPSQLDKLMVMMNRKNISACLRRDARAGPRGPGRRAWRGGVRRARTGVRRPEGHAEHGRARCRLRVLEGPAQRCRRARRRVHVRRHGVLVEGVAGAVAPASGIPFKGTGEIARVEEWARRPRVRPLANLKCGP
mgnify:CR=1 FL=1